MDRDGRLRKIAIVGGGTAGWLAALYLHRIVRRSACEVVLVESATIGTIGVGEATVPTLVHLIRMLELDERELMRRCSATYKLGIRFEGWGGDGHSHWHPFGGSGHLGGLDLYQFWLHYRQGRQDADHYSDYALNAALSEGKLGPCATTLKNASYAYHLDAGAFAQYLKEIAVGEGVKHFFGTVGAVTLTEQGDIGAIDIGGGRELKADLYIDATGFSGLLIEENLKDPWIDWSNQLLCDRAVAMPLPPEETMAPYTRSIAAYAGWMWRIPLNSRTGTGYVYSSAHTSDERAVEDLIAVADLTKRRAADPRLLKMRVGRRTQFWKRNCVSIGLSSGFVEPLESTGIHLIQRAMMLLAEHLPDVKIGAPLRRSFNEMMARAYDEVRDFVVLHYLVAKRSEPFWRDAREVPISDSLDSFLALYDICGIVDRQRVDLFTEASYHYILSGCGRLPARPVSAADVSNVGAVGEALRQRRGLIKDAAAKSRSHDAMIADLHRRAI